MNWYKDGEEVLNIPSEVYGFIYLIEYTDNSKYIGKKKCFSVTKKHFGKKKLATITDKRLKTYEYITKESNWRRYEGSCELSKRKEIKRKTILEYCKSKIDLTYKEAEYLFAYNALFDTDFLNANIMSCFYAGTITGSKKNIN